LDLWSEDVPLLQDSGFCVSGMSAVDLLVDSAGCAMVVLLLLMTDVVADFFPRPLPDLSDSRRGLLPAVSVPPPAALLTAAG